MTCKEHDTTCVYTRCIKFNVKIPTRHECILTHYIVKQFASVLQSLEQYVFDTIALPGSLLGHAGKENRTL